MKITCALHWQQEQEGTEGGQQNDVSESSPDSSAEWCDAESSPRPQPGGVCAKSAPNEARQSHVHKTLNNKPSDRVNNTSRGEDAHTAAAEQTESHKPGLSVREGKATRGCQKTEGKTGKTGKLEEEAAFDHMEKTTENVMAWISEVRLPSASLYLWFRFIGVLDFLAQLTVKLSMSVV